MSEHKEGIQRPYEIHSRGVVNFFLVTIFGMMLMVGLFYISPYLGPDVQMKHMYHYRYGNSSEVPIRVHYYNRPPWIPIDVFSSCDDNCFLTAGEGNSYASSGVVIFHTPYVKERHPPKKMGQIWIFHSMEPPWLHWCKFNNWKGVFNWTISYRRDSDIMCTYGNFGTSVFNQSTWDIERSNFLKKWQKKNKDIAWMVSHCRTVGKRDDYVNILKKMTPVDIYGKCGDNKCDRSKTDECLIPYKFYLSFENQLCDDYITEKSFNLYQTWSTSIPVTRGGSNYSMFLPPGSYIDASKFTRISDLRDYVNSVSKNITKIMEYQEWRKRYRLTSAHPGAFCELCRRLHLKDKDKYRRLYDDIGEWHRRDKSQKCCRDPKDLA
ncbi:alpha-(1,3)-fucosyltransferase C-like [Ylistrum balloti]|uniref:alpha-(1,3)-fucosyltransferase C-like n=1 Tax=Ylistrum balloti TaxID=509963 RepID=UPI002905AF85|nr:alpha-(1,3)-fucosyltransferase C-like [Ylistrum balloti]